jgi:hypothetical protein
VTFDIGFRTDAADVVNIYIDGSLKHSGTTWEDYYRYDPEQNGNGHAVPNTSKLLFREGGAANSGNAGNGFLIDGVSLASSTSATCTPTGFTRDNQDLRAAQIGGPVTGALDALGCNIGVYYDVTHLGSVSGADISGANYFGVLVNGATVDVANSWVHAIGEMPLNGSQHGNAIALPQRGERHNQRQPRLQLSEERDHRQRRQRKWRSQWPRNLRLGPEQYRDRRRTCLLHRAERDPDLVRCEWNCDG